MMMKGPSLRVKFHIVFHPKDAKNPAILSNFLQKTAGFKASSSSLFRSSPIEFEFLYSNSLFSRFSDPHKPYVSTTELIILKDGLNTREFNETGAKKASKAAPDILKMFKGFDGTKIEISQDLGNDREREAFPECGIIKEVVLPCNTNSDLLETANVFERLGASSKPKSHPYIYCLDNIYYRLLPIKAPCIIFSNALLSTFSYEKVGFRGGLNGEGQYCLQVLPNRDENSFFDFRFSDRTDITSFFNESSSSVLDGAIPELQNDRVLGAERSQQLENVVPNGDVRNMKSCWVEVHAMAKRPLKILQSPPASTKAATLRDLSLKD